MNTAVPHSPVSGGKIAELLELPVIGNIQLGHDAQNLAALAYGGAVEQLSLHSNGQPDHGKHVQLLRPGQDVK